jgi:glutathione peroxidase
MRPAALLPPACLVGLALAGCGQEAGRDRVRAGSLAQGAAPAAPVAPAGGQRGSEAREDRDRAPVLLRGTVARLNGEADDLARYRGRVVLVVNTASECINTGQLGELEALHRAHRARGFVVLGFPANDFAGQEPRTNAQIAAFCERNFGVSFPMFAKGPVTGDRALGLFRRLAAASEPPSWNFTKYLLDRRGRLVQRFDPYLPADSPQVRAAIDRLLAGRPA